jgi:hypothetical protein
MHSKATIPALVVSVAALTSASASAAINTSDTLSAWTSGLSGWANSWVIPSNAPNGNYSWSGQVASASSSSATIADGGFYYAGISASGTGLSAVGAGGNSALRLDATGGPITVTFTFSANVRGIGFLVSSAVPSDPITLFTNGLVSSSTIVTVNPLANGGGTGLGFFGASAGLTDTLTSVSVTLNSGQVLELSGAYLQLVPAPGALALLGVAGIVGGRRRRS